MKPPFPCAFAMSASLAAALSVATPSVAQDGPAPVRITPEDMQDFLVSAEGDLRIVGDEYLLPTDVLFDFDKSELRPDAEPLLQKVKAHFRANETSQVHIWGHTDSKGSNQYNYLLSQKRAMAVCDWLDREVGGFNMCIGRGEEEPLLPNENPDGSDNPVNRQFNRRVTISVVRNPDINKMMDEAKSGADEALKGLREKRQKSLREQPNVE